MRGNINNVMTAIDYIESHLHEKLDLETVAGAVHFLKSHFLPDMRASSPLRIFSKPCIKNLLTSTGQKKYFIPCS